MRPIASPLVPLLAVLLGTGLAAQEARPAGANDALLGVVAVPRGKEVVIAHVLEDSPAAKAKLAAGDVLLRIDEARIGTVADVDAALRELPPGLETTVEVRRGGEKVRATVTLIARAHYPGSFLLPQEKGRTGFAAPEWYAFGWGNVPNGTKPPTLESTRGKVVVIHAFQSL